MVYLPCEYRTDQTISISPVCCLIFVHLFMPRFPQHKELLAITCHGHKTLDLSVASCCWLRLQYHPGQDALQLALKMKPSHFFIFLAQLPRARMVLFSPTQTKNRVFITLSYCLKTLKQKTIWRLCFEMLSPVSSPRAVFEGVTLHGNFQ